MTKILIYLAAWKRPEITEICFLGIERLRRYNPAKYSISAFAVISEESMIPLCEKYGIDWCMHANKPVGKKKNYGLQQIIDHDFDYLLEIGSDDLVKSEALDLYAQYFGKHHYLSLGDVYFLNSETGEAVCYEIETVYGVGRLFSKKSIMESAWVQECGFLEFMMIEDRVIAATETRDLPLNLANYLEKEGKVKILGDPVVKFWRDDLNQSLDAYSNDLMRKGGYKPTICKSDKPLLVDIKSSVNIWAYDQFRTAGEPVHYSEVVKGLSWAEMEALHKLVNHGVYA